MLLAIQSLTKTFVGMKALDAVDFDLARGEVHALLGENGAGKSTLIKCLTGAYRRDAGTLLLDDAPISPDSTAQAQALGIGTVYQEVNLLPNLTVAQNLTFGHEPRRFGIVDTRAQRRQAAAMLEGYGLDHSTHRRSDQYPIAQCDHRSRPGGREWARVRGGRQRSAQVGQRDPRRHAEGTRVGQSCHDRGWQRSIVRCRTHPRPTGLEIAEVMLQQRQCHYRGGFRAQDTRAEGERLEARVLRGGDLDVGEAAFGADQQRGAVDRLCLAPAVVGGGVKH